MTRIAGIGVYRPAWEAVGLRVLGPDEDVITLAVAAGRAALAARAGEVTRVVLVAGDPDYLDGAPLPVLLRGLDLPADVPAELRVGGAPAALDAVASAAVGTLVIAVSTGPDPMAAAALADASGLLVDDARTVANSLPMRVRVLGEQQASVYADGRVERELGWRPVVEALAGKQEKPILVGLPAKEAKRFGGRSLEKTGDGAAAAFVALAAVAEQLETGRLVAVDAAVGTAVTVADPGEARVTRDVRPPVPAGSRPRVVGAAITIPMSMPSYDRAFEAKLSLTAERCPECGTEAYPRRERCLGCGRMGAGEPFPLPRQGEVYSTVTVHAPVPGVPTPRGLAVVTLPPTTVRVLAHVTDTPADGCAIGDRGELVLRLVAIREGVPDYGYAFRPEVAS